VGLAATRLAILDPSPAGNQPMHDGLGRYHVVFNGEVYNYRTLRRELAASGYAFRTQSDTEVVLAACMRWGRGALSRFNGMWALAFYDSESGTGFLSRDRFGIKPLFYVVEGSSLRFASEIGAILCLAEVNRRVDEAALVQHLTFGYIAHPRTIYSAVRRLAPGHCVEFGANGPGAPSRYYDVPVSNNEAWRADDYSEACVDLRRALADAVVARRVSDVPIGAFLSGGLDSSIVVAHLAEAMGRPVQTFSVGYAGHEGYDETTYARLVAAQFGTEHHELVLTERDVLEAIPAILDQLGEPVGDSSIIPTSLVSRFTRGSVTVALSGDGGDELFGGYWRYLAHDARQAYRAIPRAVRRWAIEPALSAMSIARGSPLANRARQLRKLLRGGDGAPLERHVAWSRILPPGAESLVSDPEAVGGCVAEAASTATRLVGGSGAADELNRILAFDVQYSLPSDMLQKVDLGSMMHSLEVRVPFLDPAVVERAMSYPACWKIDRGRGKRILADAYRGRLPDEILDRAKQGFEVPIGEYLRGPLLGMFRDVVARGTVDSLRIVNHAAVEALLQEHVSRRADHSEVLWALLTLCWWKRNERRRE
jgi:asparagine synthase (glutamine-hydrolysing)